METGYSLADIGAMMNNRGDGWGNNGWWIIVLFFVLFRNWGNNRDTATTADVAQGFADNRIMGKLDSLGSSLSSGICDSTYALNNSIMQGNNATQREIAESRFATQQCCCETNRNIDNVRYDNAQNTCAITTNATANTQKILDKLCTMESNAKDQRIADLSVQLQTANFQLSQQAQNATIIGTLRPFPQPAYITTSPYQSIYNNGYGFGGGCCSNLY